jgi:voltage-gated sodium channel
MGIREKIGVFVESQKVQNAILGLIIFNAVTLGIETSDSITREYGTILHILDRAVLGVFVIEVGGKLFYRGFGFFKSGWNVFDFIIVGIALFPASGPLAVLRALRILRAFRLMSMVPQMRNVVQALITAIPGMLSIVALISLIFYVSSVLATNLFGADFDVWFGTIGRSMYSLFQIMTLESWSMGIVRPVMELYPYAWAFFVPFILVTSFAVINLFIGVIVDSMQTQHREVTAEVLSETATIEGKIDAVEKELGDLRQMLRQTQKP